MPLEKPCKSGRNAVLPATCMLISEQKRRGMAASDEELVPCRITADCAEITCKLEDKPVAP